MSKHRRIVSFTVVMVIRPPTHKYLRSGGEVFFLVDVLNFEYERISSQSADPFTLYMVECTTVLWVMKMS